MPRRDVAFGFGSARVVSMGAQTPETVRKNRITFGQISVAPKTDDLYDSRKASIRVPGKDMIATVRAIILVAIAGGVVWFFLWKLAADVLGKR